MQFAETFLLDVPFVEVVTCAGKAVTSSQDGPSLVLCHLLRRCNRSCGLNVLL